MSQSLIPCVYHDRYGYPYRWAIPAEVAWRLEHWFPRVPTFYRWRKAAEARYQRFEGRVRV